MIREKGPHDWSPREEIPGIPIWPGFVDAYLAAALWTSTDEEGESLDAHYSVGDFAQEAVDAAVEESNDFIKSNLKDLESVGNQDQHGHDFWLTKNHQGAGFWDRGYGAVGKRLTDAAHPYGEGYVYVGDDGKLYIG